MKPWPWLLCLGAVVGLIVQTCCAHRTRVPVPPKAEGGVSVLDQDLGLDVTCEVRNHSDVERELVLELD